MPKLSDLNDAYGFTDAERRSLAPRQKRDDYVLWRIFAFLLVATIIQLTFFAPWPPAKAEEPVAYSPMTNMEACILWRSGKYVVHAAQLEAVEEFCNSLGV